jgi:acyl dehydratase
MEISKDFVNTKFKDKKCSVTYRDIMLFAAALNDNNPLYLDDEREGGIIAHPLFPVRLTLPMLENLSDYISEESKVNFPFEVLMTAVHYSEYLKIHRLIKPNDKLSLKGKNIALLSHRAGTHSIIKIDATDKSGDPVFTGYHGGMLRGVTFTGDDIGRDQVPTVPKDDSKQPPIWKKDIFIDPLRSFVYDGCTETTLPIHTSKEFAHSVGLPDILLQGVCTLGLVVSGIINEELESDPTKVKEIAGKFTAMVIPNSTIRLEVINRIETEESNEFFFEVINEQGKKAIREGYLRSMK